MHTVEELRQFLGPQLKAVMGDPAVIDEVAASVQVRGGAGAGQRVMRSASPCRGSPAGHLTAVWAALQAMVALVEEAAFHPLDRARAADWAALCARFHRSADEVRGATRGLVDSCFRKLHSVDAAVDMMHSFRRIQA